MDGSQRRAHATNERSANPVARQAPDWLRLLQAAQQSDVCRSRGRPGEKLPGGKALDDQPLTIKIGLSFPL